MSAWVNDRSTTNKKNSQPSIDFSFVISALLWMKEVSRPNKWCNSSMFIVLFFMLIHKRLTKGLTPSVSRAMCNLNDHVQWFFFSSYFSSIHFNSCHFYCFQIRMCQTGFLLLFVCVCEMCVCFFFGKHLVVWSADTVSFSWRNTHRSNTICSHAAFNRETSIRSTASQFVCKRSRRSINLYSRHRIHFGNFCINFRH